MYLQLLVEGGEEEGAGWTQQQQQQQQMEEMLMVVGPAAHPQQLRHYQLHVVRLSASIQ